MNIIYPWKLFTIMYPFWIDLMELWYALLEFPLIYGLNSWSTWFHLVSFMMYYLVLLVQQQLVICEAFAWVEIL